jgi:hypothetical protein
MKIILTFLVSLSLYSCSSAPSGKKLNHQKKAIKELISKKWPGATFGNLTHCRIGKDKIESYGVVILKKNNFVTDGDIVPVIATLTETGWVLNDLPKEVKFKDEDMKSFTKDFIQNDKFSDTEIKCVNPSLQPLISDQIGKYTNDSFKKTNHLCFDASNLYNNWVCFNIEQGSKEVKQSFVQFEVEE